MNIWLQPMTGTNETRLDNLRNAISLAMLVQNSPELTLEAVELRDLLDLIPHDAVKRFVELVDKKPVRNEENI